MWKNKNFETFLYHLRPYVYVRHFRDLWQYVTFFEDHNERLHIFREWNKYRQYWIYHVEHQWALEDKFRIGVLRIGRVGMYNKPKMKKETKYSLENLKEDLTQQFCDDYERDLLSLGRKRKEE